MSLTYKCESKLIEGNNKSWTQRGASKYAPLLHAWKAVIADALVIPLL
ncbi:hypothetical protein EV06_0839 [Prochlorococcus sp. MIT 0602]|nr:hypothetical protein EV06_0839 [Prochlorococcus sp. MIT 0602]KGG17247.1 hypothetical protein EV07_0685 [Prochlorococcus sp. MIT 0603]